MHTTEASESLSGRLGTVQTQYTVLWFMYKACWRGSYEGRSEFDHYYALRTNADCVDAVGVGARSSTGPISGCQKRIINPKFAVIESRLLLSDRTVSRCDVESCS